MRLAVHRNLFDVNIWRKAIDRKPAGVKHPHAVWSCDPEFSVGGFGSVGSVCALTAAGDDPDSVGAIKHRDSYRWF
jgi:hypothetical protein